MNNKENSKHSIAPKSKDSKNIIRKPSALVTPRGEDTNKHANDRSNTQSRKSVMVKNNIVEQNLKDKRKTVSPNILTGTFNSASGINSSKNSKNLNQNNNLNLKSKKSENINIVKEEKSPEKESKNNLKI
jgi:ketol-acid reductoisomerase